MLDEPTAHLDPRTAAELVRDVFAAAGDRTVLLITHRSEGLDLVDRVLTLRAHSASAGHGHMPATLRGRSSRATLATMGSTTDKRHVVIVGGGFAGLGCAQRLADHEDVTVTLIDRNNHHQFQPLLYQVATSQLAPSDIAHSLRGVFAGRENVDVKLADIAAIDTAAKTVTASDGEEWTGDALVLAAGSQPNFFGTPGASEHSFPLYSLDDATRLRSRILGLFEQVDRDPALVDRGALNFVIVGGGPTGVEVAGAIGRHAQR